MKYFSSSVMASWMCDVLTLWLYLRKNRCFFRLTTQFEWKHKWNTCKPVQDVYYRGIQHVSCVIISLDNCIFLSFKLRTNCFFFIEFGTLNISGECIFSLFLKNRLQNYKRFIKKHFHLQILISRNISSSAQIG